MHRWLLSVVVLTLFCCPVLAQDKHDGNALNEKCTSALGNPEHPTSMDGFNTGVCFGLVDGIKETMMLWNTVDSQHSESKFHGCIPTEVTLEEAVKVVMKYLNDNPTQLHFRDVHLIYIALAKGYPCPAIPPGTTK
jgi:hypothetical protein